MKHTCVNCKYFNHTMRSDDGDYHFHYWCDRWQGTIPAFNNNDDFRELNLYDTCYMYDSVECGLAQCFCFEKDIERAPLLSEEKMDQFYNANQKQLEDIKKVYAEKLNVINCKAYNEELLNKAKESPKTGKLISIVVGNNSASEAYIKGRSKDAAYCSVDFEIIRFNDNVTQIEIENCIDKYNNDNSVGGIIVQLPLPEHLNEKEIVNRINPNKDVDGFTLNSKFKPCTPEGIMWLLHKEIGNIEGLNILVIGRGDLVCKPLVPMLLNENASVTIAHSKSHLDTLLLTGEFDIIISGIGKSVVDLSLCSHQLKLVIDAGIYRDENNKLHGDCYNHSYNVKYTSVPGGVGLMTRAMLMTHMIKEE